MEQVIQAAVLCVVAALLALVLKKGTPEAALLLTLGIMLAAAARCLALAAPALEELRTLFARAGLEEAHIAVLLKTVAAALVTKLCADLCRDGGSQALATTVEAAGAVAALVLAMPLLRAVAELLLGFFG